jgi:hypothetical protein
VLASEIPNYVFVPEYLVETPANLVFHTIKPVLQRFGIPTETQQSILRDALREEGGTSSGRPFTELPNPKALSSGNAAFPTEELDRFVGNVGTIGGKRLHRTRRRRLRRVLREKTRGKKRAKKGQEKGKN